VGVHPGCWEYKLCSLVCVLVIALPTPFNGSFPSLRQFSHTYIQSVFSQRLGRTPLQTFRVPFLCISLIVFLVPALQVLVISTSSDSKTLVF
jgi:hypothetical protein